MEGSFGAPSRCFVLYEERGVGDKNLGPGEVVFSCGLCDLRSFEGSRVLLLLLTGGGSSCCEVGSAVGEGFSEVSTLNSSGYGTGIMPASSNRSQTTSSLDMKRAAMILTASESDACVELPVLYPMIT